MTFEEWFAQQDFWTGDDKEYIEILWNDAQQAEREKRKPLTDEEMNDELVKANVYQAVTAFARAVERRVNGEEG